MTQVNKKDRIRLIGTDSRLDSLGLQLNQKGTVISTRYLPSDVEPLCLINFGGRLDRIVVNQNQVEIVE